MTLQELKNEAQKLTEGDRAALAVSLLEGLDDSAYDVSDEEIQRRVKDANENPGDLLTLEEVMAGLNERAG